MLSLKTQHGRFLRSLIILVWRALRRSPSRPLLKAGPAMGSGQFAQDLRERQLRTLSGQPAPLLGFPHGEKVSLWHQPKSLCFKVASAASHLPAVHHQEQSRSAFSVVVRKRQAGPRPPAAVPPPGWRSPAPSAFPPRASPPGTELSAASAEPAPVYRYLSRAGGPKTRNNPFPGLSGHALVGAAPPLSAVSAAGSRSARGRHRPRAFPPSCSPPVSPSMGPYRGSSLPGAGVCVCPHRMSRGAPRPIAPTCLNPSEWFKSMKAPSLASSRSLTKTLDKTGPRADRPPALATVLQVEHGALTTAVTNLVHPSRLQCHSLGTRNLWQRVSEALLELK